MLHRHGCISHSTVGLMPQVHVGANCFSRIISSALGGWPTRCQGNAPPRPRRCRKVPSTLTGVLTMRSKMPAKSAVDCITSYTHRISERRSTGLMGNPRTCNNRLRKPSTGNQTQETKFRKRNLGSRSQETKRKQPTPGHHIQTNQTQETTCRKPNSENQNAESNPGSQNQETKLRKRSSGNQSQETQLRERG